MLHINKLKFISAFIADGLIFSGVTYAATTRFASGDVAYDNTTSGLSSSNVKSTLDELYAQYNSGDAVEGDIIDGKTAFINGSLRTGTIINQGEYVKAL